MSNVQTERNGRIQKPGNNGGNSIERGGDSPKSLAALVMSMQDQIKAALPKHLSPDRMARVVTTALRTTPGLAECTPVSFLGCVMQCAQLGLEPNTPMGHAYLIPRNSKNLPPGVKECSLIVGYQGYIDIAARAGVTVYSYVVRKGDRFSYKLGLDPDVVHEPSEAADREEQPVTHAYAVCKLKDGRTQFVVLSKAQIDARRARGGSGDRFSPWKTDYEAMALKSAVRALWKWMPKSVEYVTAEAVEVAAESGRSQLPAMSHEVGEMLLASGHATQADVDAVADAGHDPVTGEVKTERQPGDDDDDGTLTPEEEAKMEAELKAREAAKTGGAK